MAARRAYSEAEVEAAIQALSDPERLDDAQRMVGANAPGIQRILNEALHAADWFGSAHQAAVLEAAGKPAVDDRVVAVRTLIAVPAGLAGMGLVPFTLYYAIGGLVWTAFLAGAGYLLRENYDAVEGWLNPVTTAVVVVIVALYLYRLVRALARRRRA